LPAFRTHLLPANACHCFCPLAFATMLLLA
jgi:hypothetical protein